MYSLECNLFDEMRRFLPCFIANKLFSHALAFGLIPWILNGSRHGVESLKKLF